MVGKLKFLFVVIVYIVILWLASASLFEINVCLAQMCRHLFNSDFGARLALVVLYAADIITLGFVVFCSGLFYWLSLKQVRLGLIGYTLLKFILNLEYYFRLFNFTSDNGDISNYGYIKSCGIQIGLDIIVLITLLGVSKLLFQMGREVRGRLLSKKSNKRQVDCE